MLLCLRSQRLDAGLQLSRHKVAQQSFRVAHALDLGGEVSAQSESDVQYIVTHNESHDRIDDAALIGPGCSPHAFLERTVDLEKVHLQRERDRLLERLQPKNTIRQERRLTDKFAVERSAHAWPRRARKRTLKHNRCLATPYEVLVVGGIWRAFETKDRLSFRSIVNKLL